MRDALGSAGFCVDPPSQTACLTPPMQIGQSPDCGPGLSCCYYPLTNVITPSPLNPIFPTQSPFFPAPVTPYNPYYPTTYSPYNPYYPATFNPFNPFNPVTPNYPYYPTTYNPFNPPILPPTGRICGRLISASGFDGIRMDSSPFPEVETLRGMRAVNNTGRMKRIVGGDLVPNNEYCYQAAILSGSTVVATGVLLSDDYVLTSYSGIAK